VSGVLGALGWLDVVAGLGLAAVAGVAVTTSRRYAVLGMLAAAAWFAGDLSDHALLIHRPLVLHAVLAYPDGRLPGRGARALVALAWVGALAPALGAHPAVALPFAAAIGGQALWMRAGAPLGRRRLAVTSMRAALVLAASLALPTLARLAWPGPAAAGTVTAGYDVLILVAALLLLAGLVGRSVRETDAVIELSDGTPEQTLAALRSEATARGDPGLPGRPSTSASLSTAVALLESNAALQVGLAEKVDEVRASRARLVTAAVAERQRLERVLADGAQRYLDQLAETLQALRERGDATMRQLASTCLDEVDRTRDDLAQLARGLHPRTLSDHGLAVALAELGDHSPVPVTVTAPRDRFPEAAETALWYACAEALANLTKHAAATAASVAVTALPGELVAAVCDNGRGGARATPGGGLAGLADRLAAVDGALAVGPGPSGGTLVQIQVPLP
jgi:signal transduction histidine kinase